MNTYSLKANFSRFAWSNALAKLADVLLIVLLTLGLSRVEAAEYYEIAIGQAKLKNNKDDGWWRQNGSDQVFSENSPTWAVRAGWNLKEWMSVEVGARDLGRLNTVGSFVSDETYAKIAAGTCQFPCGDQVVSVYGEGRVYGLDARLKLKYGMGNFAPFATVGLFAYKSSYQTRVIDRTVGSGNFYSSVCESESRVRRNFSVGLEYKSVFVELQIDPNVGTQNSAVENAQTITFGVKF